MSFSRYKLFMKDLARQWRHRRLWQRCRAEYSSLFVSHWQWESPCVAHTPQPLPFRAILFQTGRFFLPAYPLPNILPNYSINIACSMHGQAWWHELDMVIIFFVGALTPGDLSIIAMLEEDVGHTPWNLVCFGAPWWDSLLKCSPDVEWGFYTFLGWRPFSHAPYETGNYIYSKRLQ